MNITKWAFGTAPLKKETHLKNIGAIENVSKFLDNLDVPTDGLLMSISWVKGMFRCLERVRPPEPVILALTVISPSFSFARDNKRASVS